MADDVLIIGATVFVPVAIIAGVLIAHTTSTRAIQSVGEGLASAGLSIEKWPRRLRPSVEGRLGGRHFIVYPHRRGKNGPWHTKVMIRHEWPPGVNLSLYRVGVGSLVAKRLGARVAATGDAVFDAAFVVSTKDDARAKFMLDETSRAATLALRVPTLRVHDDYATLELPGRLADAAPVLQALGLLERLATRPEATAAK